MRQQTKNYKKITIYTDGACSGNPGVGGWGAILIWQNKRREISGAEVTTTNNRMELKASIEALKCVKEKCIIDLYTDSVYLKDGITKWSANWLQTDWKTANKKPVKNADLWQELLSLKEKHIIQWHWLKGHNGHLENEKADKLATEALKQLKKELNL